MLFICIFIQSWVMSNQIYIVPTDSCYGIGCWLDDQASYEKIYELKWRDKSRPFSILVPSWDDLKYESKLTHQQVNFLKTYKFPFTIICDIQSDFRDEYHLLGIYGYTSIGFRVGENCLPAESLWHLTSPIFLTSANKSWEKECNTLDEVKRVFSDNYSTFTIIPWNAWGNPASNVIQFIWNTNELRYLRKNYPLR